MNKYYDEKHEVWDELRKAVPEIDEWMEKPIGNALILFPIRNEYGLFKLKLERVPHD